MEGLDRNAKAASYVSPDRVDRFLAELKARVGSVTVYGSIYKLRRMAQLLAPGQDFTWHREGSRTGDAATVKIRSARLQQRPA
jgi:hypothetical protein